MRSIVIRTFIMMALGSWLLLGSLPDASTNARPQDEGEAFTLAGDWLILSFPIDSQFFSRMGNTLGFPDRHMRFQEEEEVRTGLVFREDAGPNVMPLGVWRVKDDQFSATFQLWCPEKSQPCGSIVMRGHFVNADRIRGTATAFFDVPDPGVPTGFDTWPMTIRGDRIGGEQ